MKGPSQELYPSFGEQNRAARRNLRLSPSRRKKDCARLINDPMAGHSSAGRCPVLEPQPFFSLLGAEKIVLESIQDATTWFSGLRTPQKCAEIRAMSSSRINLSLPLRSPNLEQTIAISHAEALRDLASPKTLIVTIAYFGPLPIFVRQRVI